MYFDYGPDTVDVLNPIADHPLNVGLVGWWLSLPNLFGSQTLWDLCGRRNGELINGTTWQTGYGGFGANSFNRSSSQYVTVPSVSLATTADLTLVWWQFVPAAVESSAFTIGNGDNPSRCQAHAPYSDGTLYWDFGNSSGGRLTASYSSHIGKWTQVALEASGSGNWQAIYLDGRLINSTTSSATIGSPLSGLYIGGWLAFSLFATALMSDFRMYNRLLFPAAISHLYEESVRSYPTLLNRIRPLSFGVAADEGGGTVTLPADAGSYTVTGQSATLRRALRLDSAAGAYSLSGQTANLLYNRLLSADAGSYSLSGQSASLLNNRVVVGGTGSYSVNGQDATLLNHQRLTADNGSYTVDGQDATLTVNTGDGADAGSYSLNGQNANLLRNRLVSADAGSYSVSGQDATLLRNRLVSADAGSYAVDGQDATLKHNHRLDAEAGQFTLTGRNAILIGPDDEVGGGNNSTLLTQFA